jgi:enoyl-CoA hydratase
VEVSDAVATFTLNRPERLNAVTPQMIDALDAALADAIADDTVRVVRLRGAGRAFCSGYDLEWSAQLMHEGDQAGPWDPAADYRLLSRYVNSYMALWRSPKPVVAQVHGVCVGGGSDLALCSDLIVCADSARIGYPPARVWGVPTSALWAFRVGDQRAKRLLFSGDLIDGRTALDWGLAVEAHPAEELDARFDELVERIALTPVNQLVMMKLLVNQTLFSQGLHATQALGVFFDGIARHTPEGYAFQQRAAEVGFKEAVQQRDQPYDAPQSRG